MGDRKEPRPVPKGTVKPPPPPAPPPRKAMNRRIFLSTAMTRQQRLIVMKAAGLFSLLDQGIVPPNIQAQAHELLDEIGAHFGDEMQALADGADDDEQT